MPEQVNETESTDDNKTEQAAEVDVDKIIESAKASASEVVQEKINEALEKNSGISKDDLDKAIKAAITADRANLAKTISGKGDETGKQVHPLIADLAKDPEEHYAKLVNLVINAVEDKDNKARAQQEEQYGAWKDVVGGREDITSSDKKQDLFWKFYAEEDEGKSEKERMESALKRYDLVAEELGAGKAEERIQKAVGLSSESATQSSSKESSKSEMELAREEHEERIRAFKKSRNRLIEV